MSNQKKSRWHFLSPWFTYAVRTLSLFFVLVLPSIVKAQFTFTTNNGAITITGYTGPGGSVVIPDTTNGYPVTSIGDYAFLDSSMTNVFIPDSITNIGMNAFAQCYSLTSIIIPDSITNIEFGAFEGCTSLMNVILSDSIINIGDESFYGCMSLTNIAIPDSVTSIGDSAFGGCTNLSSITIPNDVTNIGVDAFLYCLNMTNIFVEAGNPDYSSLNGVLFDKAQDTLVECPSGLTNNAYNIPDGVITIAGDAFDYCRNVTSFAIPGSVTNIIGPPFNDCTSLTNICVSATNPAYCALDGVLFDRAQDTLIQYPPGLTNTSYTIPNSVATIQGDAFSFCAHLVSIAIPNSVTNIGEWGTFLGCSSLASVVVPNGVTSIPDDAFSYCTSLTSIIIPDSVMSIGLEAFQQCSSLTSITIPASVTNLDDLVFVSCGSLTSAYFQGNAPAGGGGAFGETPATVYYLPGTTGWGATYGNVPAVEETPACQFIWVTNSDAVSVTITGYTGPGGSVVIPNTINGYYVTSVGTNAFQECTALTSVTIPDGVTSIDFSAFASCASLTNVILPDSIINIGDLSFAGCSSLASFTIPNSVTSIGVDAFEGCTSLGSISIPNSVTNIGVAAFVYCTNMTNIIVDAGNPDYSSLDGVLFEKTPNTLLLYPSGVTNRDYTIPNGVQAIAESAFWYCPNLLNITIPGSLTNIIGTPFYDCTSLTNICVNATNPAYSSLNGVLFDKAQDTLVQYPPGLANASYTIPDSVTTIQSEAFSDCISLVNITIPNGITSLGYGAFLGCSSLASVVILNGVTSIPEVAFAQCPSLASVIIPDSVTNIGPLAFNDCPSLASITIPASVNDIESLAFISCDSLTSVYFEGNAPPDSGNAFYSDPVAVVYYLPGTTGWGPTFGGVQAVLWNPQAENALVTACQFGFEITGPTNAVIVIQACTNLTNPIWIPVSTNILDGNGISSFSDSQWANYPNRFYRFSSQ